MLRPSKPLNPPLVVPTHNAVEPRVTEPVHRLAGVSGLNARLLIVPRRIPGGQGHSVPLGTDIDHTTISICNETL